MGSGYRTPKQIEHVLVDLQKQLDSLRVAARLTSSTISDEQGKRIAQYGIIPTTRIPSVGGAAFPDTSYGAKFFNPATDDIILAAASYLSDGLSYVQIGDGTTWDALDLFRLFANNANLNTADYLALNAGLYIALDAVTTVNLRAGTRIFIDGNEGVDINTGGDLHLYELPTTGSSANLRLDPGTAQIQYVTSSERYKQDIEDVTVDPADVLKLQGRTWRQKTDVQADPDTEVRHVGFIAEELDDAGLGVFVEYDAEGRPDAIQYDRLSVGLVELAKSQQKQLDDQAAQLAALSARLDALEAAT